MFEIGIICVIFLAVGYWAVLWTMGRREDVLHGEFVEADAQPAGAVRSTPSKQQVRPIFPEPPVQPVPERPLGVERPVVPVRPVVSERPAQAAVREQPARTPALKQPAFRSERLDSLLISIKQDLNQLVQK